MKVKANLFINFYQDKNSARQRELNICTLSNIHNPEIDTINVLVESIHVKALIDLIQEVEEDSQTKVNIIKFEGRPTYNNYFKFTEKYPNDINILSNTDIIIGISSLSRLKKWDWKNYCLAICRWDFVNQSLSKKEATHYNHADSQDVWMVKGSFPQIKGAEFGLGYRGCDNSIAHLLKTNYQVINPSVDIKTYHYHLTEIRNYIHANGQMDAAIPPPYHLMTPILLPNE